MPEKIFSGRFSKLFVRRILIFRLNSWLSGRERIYSVLRIRSMKMSLPTLKLQPAPVIFFLIPHKNTYSIILVYFICDKGCSHEKRGREKISAAYSPPAASGKYS